MRFADPYYKLARLLVGALKNCSEQEPVLSTCCLLTHQPVYVAARDDGN
jgi:hypothetical protein